MYRGYWRVALLLVTVLLGVAGFMAYKGIQPHPADEGPKPIPLTSELKWKIDDAVHAVLPAGGFMLSFQESQKCNGVAVIKTTGSGWRLGLAWYDIRSGEVTDVVKREELVERLASYVEVWDNGLQGVRKIDGIPEMYVGTILEAAESVWLQLDPDSCGVRTGWLVYRKLTGSQVNRQRITW